MLQVVNWTTFDQAPGRPVHPHVPGERPSQRFQPMMRSVHPHVRGERAGDRRRCAKIAGSSPRAWGTLILLAKERLASVVQPRQSLTIMSALPAHRATLTHASPQGWILLGPVARCLIVFVIVQETRDPRLQ
jgi:hypothetical protein